MHSPNPRGVQALLGRRNLDLDILWRESLQLANQPIAEALEERGAAGQHHILEQLLPQVHVRLQNRVGQDLVDALRLIADQIGPEQKFGRPVAARA